MRCSLVLFPRPIGRTVHLPNSLPRCMLPNPVVEVVTDLPLVAFRPTLRPESLPHTPSDISCATPKFIEIGVFLELRSSLIPDFFLLRGWGVPCSCDVSSPSAAPDSSASGPSVSGSPSCGQSTPIHPSPYLTYFTMVHGHSRTFIPPLPRPSILAPRLSTPQGSTSTSPGGTIQPEYSTSCSASFPNTVGS